MQDIVIDYNDSTTMPTDLLRVKGLGAKSVFTVMVMALLYHCRDTKQGASRKRLAKALGLSVQSVHTALKNLSALGFITKTTNRSEDGGWLASSYEINDQAIREAIEASKAAR